jgi:hypothetical protein
MDLHLFLRLKRFLAGNKFDSNDELKDSVEKCLTSAWWLISINRAYKTSCPIMTSASVWAMFMLKSRLRYVELDNNEKKLFTSSIHFL